MHNKRIARAKINLSLHVVGQREDGYHLLDSIVAFADFGDELTFAPAEKLDLRISGPFGSGLSDGKDNLILRAAQRLSTGQGAQIDLLKNLPVASGIGGGSADAAATLLGCAELWRMPNSFDFALDLGADVPICLRSQTLRMQGIGDVISPLWCLPALPMVLVNSGDAVSTPEVFSRLRSKENAPLGKMPNAEMTIGAAVAWIAQQRNDLEQAATDIVPRIADVLATLHGSGAELARMSGSGASCFGLYPSIDAAEMAAMEISKRQPNWWVRAGVLGD
ncbi:4-diphosphocytidyl-2-C-methyl-D-erythritol kinase [Amylibacter marinus]|uniref:4-diphosphocytidyl-2-C-methyl-D-erythritol kinase n=1 Tax=Amylibacter marinus TaxID=1475483 RepID=A0ABQ5VX38_9RHOB|nr:4-(cytidine 5'-diphospho)-2-C-methyl-D-erythritol kinase [Amylibacter marinus]GLQ35857.1 4-diphosphocytidyl-2-C-methyl-D-erythritol kinase [Amylibacter marinus]